MTRENGFYWVQVIPGRWEVVRYSRGFWQYSIDDTLTDSDLHAIHAERIKEPDYQP